MELVFDVVSAQQFVPGLLTTKTFKQAGGIIGRAEDCDWVIPDRKRVLSSRHAEVSYRDGAFFLTDTSSNGIQLKDTGASLDKGRAQRIEHGSVYCLGDFEIRARLIQDPASFEGDIGRPQPAGSIIPDDAFLDLDPLTALDQQERVYAEVDDLTAVLAPSRVQAQQRDYAQIDEENLQVPELVMPRPAAQPKAAPEPERLPPDFWTRFGEALGVDLDELDEEARQALALKAASLLRQSVGGLQQALRTRGELKNEMRLSLTTVQSAGNNPLKHSIDSGEALTLLLRGGKPGQLPAEQAVGRAFRDLQAHQVAMLAASRAALKGMLEQLSPDQLALRFERDNKPLIATSGGRWRAYRRMHLAMQRDDDWSERLFARDFAQAYEEQVRLIATLNTDLQG
ncbi:type VI secretion system-associated FHA domain protein TagH [Stutzerimonas nosocomialis]|uniref:Type VI secretion system-associated FHA domain protein TagH n=1 Tax=Stutzerimonas nosocomialis TaxID=1056496 RepID=A0A5R9Q9S5_9GAMM|nr:type VI secretion system-associated FHA domain protein TagH [Stutzerimonas nosocomialis]TLX61202.1 type VI secretion system-associated FHA domain protein TagH [Stutzerimonas nosocomialis]TLX61562.1 type VI secretion system-associated FHA domain protein TagH [Stutzerimonas nosocomialis]